MVFDELLLQNFGVYKGQQNILLTPPSSDKPVVLIGGLNGGGKTTFLEAIHIVLYGKRTRCYDPKTYNYETFIKRNIHKGVALEDGGAIELKFRHRADGEENHYHIRRSWSFKNKNMKETVQVHLNENPDRFLSETWDEYIEGLIPIGISHLFLFDGEKIESFADREGASELLSTAIHSLLGIDLVDRLGEDLATLERRKKAELKGSEEVLRIKDLEKQFKELEKTCGDYALDCGGQTNTVELLKKELRKIEARFRKEGGEFYNQRVELEEQRNKLEENLELSKDKLRSVAAQSAAPLLLLTHNLRQVEQQLAHEKKAKGAQSVFDVLVARDDQLLKAAKHDKMPTKWLTWFQDHIKEDRAKRESDAGSLQYLNCEEETHDKLHQFLFEQASILRGHSSTWLHDSNQRLEELQIVESKLSQVPPKETIEKIIVEREGVEEKLEQAQATLRELEFTLQQHRIQKERVGKKLRDYVDADFEKSDVQHMIKHSGVVRGVLEQFRHRMVERHSNRIASFILDSFRKLLRKKSLVSDLKIDSSSFAIALSNKKGELAPDQLSVGERQLMAVSMLWGLAQASGRPLPTVIDTPLGRLDSKHRLHLVERYFPAASHQVILLSTDEEIDEHYYKKLSPWIGREYFLHFDDEASATTIEEGYFW